MTYLIMIPVFVYWVIDKKKDLYTLVSCYLCCGFNAMLKLTACIYRPWIKDARVLPAGDAIRTAAGYSFPSQRPCHHSGTDLRRSGGVLPEAEQARLLDPDRSDP